MRSGPGRRAMLAMVVGASALTALAQPLGRPDAADPRAPVPDMKQRSAFPQYQPYEEPKLADWRQALDELAARAGGRASAGAGHEDHAKPKPAAPPAKARASKDYEHLAMAKPHAGPPDAKPARTDLVSATGVIREIDKAKARVRITHEPIDALGWPRLTVFARLKDSALAEKISENEKVRFTLEKMADGYVIAGFQQHQTSQAHHK